MSDEAETAVTESAAPAADPVAETTTVVKKKAAPKKKVAAPKKKAAKKVAKKSPAKKTAKKKTAKKKAAASGEPRRSDDTRDTIRLRMFKLLKKNVNGLTGSQIKEKLELSGVPNILRDEGIVAKPPRVRRSEIEGVRGVVYQLTAAGLKALEKGTVNSEAPASAGGLEW